MHIIPWKINMNDIAITYIYSSSKMSYICHTFHGSIFIDIIQLWKVISDNTCLTMSDRTQSGFFKLKTSICELSNMAPYFCPISAVKISAYHNSWLVMFSMTNVNLLTVSSDWCCGKLHTRQTKTLGQLVKKSHC